MEEGTTTETTTSVVMAGSSSGDGRSVADGLTGQEEDQLAITVETNSINSLQATEESAAPAELFSPGQQARSEGKSQSPEDVLQQQQLQMSDSAKLLASTFALDQNRQLATGECCEAMPTNNAASATSNIGTFERATESDSSQVELEQQNHQEEKTENFEEKRKEGNNIKGAGRDDEEEEKEKEEKKECSNKQKRQKEERQQNSPEKLESNKVLEQQQQQSPSEEHERQTSDLIRKQLAEIEREISRRMQNKNVKKMDEQEMRQLLLDHGLAGLSNNTKGTTKTTEESSESIQGFARQHQQRNAPSPSLDQIRQQQQHHLHQATTATFVQASSPQPPSVAFFPQPFAAPNQISLQRVDGTAVAQSTQSFASMPFGQHPQQQQQHPSAVPYAASVPFLPQQQSFPAANADGQSTTHSPPFAQILPSNLSAITPEMAAALLAQLQHQNPALLQGIVAQQQQQQQLQFSQYYSAASPSTATTSPLVDSAKISSPSSSHFRTSVTIPTQQQKSQNGGSNSSTISHSVALPAPPRAAQTFGNFAGNSKRRAQQQQQQQRRASISGGKASTASTTNFQNGGEIEASHQKTLQQTTSAEWSGAEGGAKEGEGSFGSAATAGTPAIAPGEQPIWVMRESYLKRRERDEQRRREAAAPLSEEMKWKINQQDELAESAKQKESDIVEGEETDRLLLDSGEPLLVSSGGKKQNQQEIVCSKQNTGGSAGGASMEEPLSDSASVGGKASRKGSKKEVIIHEPAVLIEGVLFRARYLGSTQMSSDGRPTKSSRMAQAQEAVARVKAPEGEPQPCTEIDLFISTEKIMVLNTDLQRISETDVRQDILMDHSLRSISYIADIGDLVVLMARRVPSSCQQQEQDCDGVEAVRKAPRVVCHVFESEEANFIAQSIGQAFQVAYMEFLRANGIEDPSYLRDIDYQEVLNSQEMMAEELELLARKETQKDVVIAKRSGEPLGVVIVESGWGSMLPTSVVANLAPGGAASRSNQLNIGDQIIGVNGISLVGLPLSAAQQNIKNARSSTAVRLTVVSTPPVVEVRIRRPDTKYQLGFSVQNGVICSLLRGGIAERGGIRVGHRIIEINQHSVVAVPHERIVNMLATATGEIHMKTMPTSMFRLLTGQEVPNYI